MKMINKIKLIVIVLLCSFISCEDSSKDNMNIQKDSNNTAPYVRVIFNSNTLIKFAEIETSIIDMTLSTPGNNVAEWKTSVRLVSGDDASEYVPLDALTVTSFPATVSITIVDIATALGIEVGDILPADVLEFKSTSTGLDGKVLTAEDLGINLKGQKEQRQSYAFSIAISCAPVASAAGEWTIEMEDTFGDGWDGAFLTAEIDGVATKYTIKDGSTATHTFTVPAGAALTFSYTKGNFEEEHIFTIEGPDGTIYGPFNGGDGIPFCFF
jgi:hypothetical protein